MSNYLDANQKRLSEETEVIQKEETLVTAEPVYSAPDGGLQAWLVVFASWFLMAMTFGVINTFGVYETYYVSIYQNLSTSRLSVIGAIAPTIICLSSVPAIMVMQLLSARITAFIGSLIIVVSFMLLSLINASWQIYLTQGVLFGIGAGLVYVLNAQVIFQWFQKKKSLAFGIASSGSCIGGIYWPIAARKLIQKINFGWICRIIGFIMLPMLICVLLFFKENPEFLEFQETKRQAKRVNTDSEIVKKPKKVHINFYVLKEWQFNFLVLANVFGYFSLFPCLFYLDLYIKMLPGISTKLKEFNIPILNAASVVGRILPGYLGDKIGTLNSLIPFLVLTGVLQLALWIPMRSDAAVACFCVFTGISSGVIVSMFPACVGQLFAIEHLHSYLSILFAISSVGTMLGPVFGGMLISSDATDISVIHKDFRNLGIFCGIFCLFSAMLLIAVRQSRTKKIFCKM